MPRQLTPKEVEALRAKICETAQRLFAENGYEGVTMRALAAAMGTSPMQPYHYFNDKDEILAEVLTRAFDRFVTALEEAGRDEGHAYGRARAMRYVYSQLALSEPGIYRMMFELPHPKEGDYPGMSEAMDRARNCIRRCMEDLIAAGLVAGDPDLLGHVFWGAVHGPLTLHLAGKLPTNLNVDTVIDTAIMGLFYSLAPKS